MSVCYMDRSHIITNDTSYMAIKTFHVCSILCLVEFEKKKMFKPLSIDKDAIAFDKRVARKLNVGEIVAYKLLR